MADSCVKLHYDVVDDDFTVAGEASGAVKKVLKQLGFPSEIIRRVAIAMYECEINMVIHADGGLAEVYVWDDSVRVVLSDKGPGIPNIDLAMQEGFSTAKDNIRALGFGAGMGLPNMKRYADDLNISTVVGEGTTVTMNFFVSGGAK